MIEVKATDANTFVILDDQLSPWNASEGQPIFGKYFSSRDEAKDYCHTMLEQHPNVVFWIYEENREPEQIAKQDRRDEAETTDNGLSNTPLTDTSHESLIGRLWYGEISLSKTYWLYGFLGNLLFALPLIYWETASSYETAGRTFILVMLLYVVWAVIYALFICVAICRSASKYIGPSRWAILAKIAVVLGVMRLLGDIANYSPVYIEMARLGLNLEDDYKYVITQSSEKLIKIEGGIGLGLTRDLSKQLKTNQKTVIIQLESRGGLANEGYRLRDFLKTAALITYTETECSSACVAAFMGGKRRILHKDGKLGFHSPAQTGPRNPTWKDKRDIQRSIKEDKDLFIQSGISAELVEKAFRIPSDKMWYPTRQELIDAGVITHTYDGSKSTPHQKQGNR